MGRISGTHEWALGDGQARREGSRVKEVTRREEYNGEAERKRCITSRGA